MLAVLKSTNEGAAYSDRIVCLSHIHVRLPAVHLEQNGRVTLEPTPSPKVTRTPEHASVTHRRRTLDESAVLGQHHDFPLFTPRE